MTTEHVSVPREVYENLAQISEGNMSKHDMQDLASEAYNILSRATPSDVRCTTCDGTGDVHRADGEWLGECTACDAKKTSAPHVVTDEDVERACSVYFGEYFWPDDVEETDLVRASVREMLEDFATSLPLAMVPDGLADELLDAWRNIAHVSGSAFLSGEKKAQTSKQRELVYGMACNARITIGNAYYELTGKNPDFDTAPQAGEKG